MSHTLKPRASFHPAVKDAACGALALSVGIIALMLVVALIAPFMNSAASNFVDIGRLG